MILCKKLSSALCLLSVAAIFWNGSVFAQKSSLATQTIPAAVDAQPLAEDRGANGLWQELQRLHTWASLMTIVAHPDDEDGGMLTYESRGNGVRTSLMTLTRGEGGQNVMSSDADDALGLIRTNELLKADEYYGAAQYWGRVADYGFSKTIEEAFQQWGHERVLYDVVRAVRINRPLVITATFIGGITDGHGQHQVSGEIAQEVFTAAGDPNVFPDQIKAGLRPWSPLKVYARVPNYSIGKEGIFDYATGKWAPVRFYNYVTKEWSTTAPATNVVVPGGKLRSAAGTHLCADFATGMGISEDTKWRRLYCAAGRSELRLSPLWFACEQRRKRDVFLRWSRYIADGNCESGAWRYWISQEWPADDQ